MSREKNRHWQVATGNAAAAAAMYLVGGPVADAQGGIVYNNTPISVVIATPGTVSVPWDIDGNAIADFTLSTFLDFSASVNGGGRFINRVSVSEDGIEALGNVASVLDVGPNLPAGYFWGAANAVRTMISIYTAVFSYGADAMNNGLAFGWGPPISQLVGFRFGTGINERFGWAHMEINLAQGKLSVLDWAYEDTGGAIH